MCLELLVGSLEETGLFVGQSERFGAGLLDEGQMELPVSREVVYPLFPSHI